MEFLFLVCKQLSCRQLSPVQGGKLPVDVELAAWLGFPG
jgi:hypothetical protein